MTLPRSCRGGNTLSHPPTRFLLVQSDGESSNSVAAALKNPHETVVTSTWDNALELLDHADFRLLISNHEQAITLVEKAREAQRWRTLLHDSASALPTRSGLMPDFAQQLSKDGSIAVLWIDATPLWNIDAESKSDVRPSWQHEISCILKSLITTILRSNDRLTVDDIDSPYFCIFLSAPRDAGWNDMACGQRIAHRVRSRIHHELSKRGLHAPTLRGKSHSGTNDHGVRVGWSRVTLDAHYPSAYQVRLAVERARASAEQRHAVNEVHDNANSIDTLLGERRLRCLFQPMYDLKTNLLIGYEGLARGPTESPYEFPENLLSLAAEHHRLTNVDRLMRETVFTRAIELPAPGRIFFNTHPTTLTEDSSLRADRLGYFLNRLGIPPRRLVLELSARHLSLITKETRHALDQLRALGIQLAIENISHDSLALDTIAQLHPDIIKIDRMLVEDIADNDVKQSLLSTWVTLAHRLNCVVIACGIESLREQECLLHLGIRYGQGYFLGKPMHPTPTGWLFMSHAMRGAKTA